MPHVGIREIQRNTSAVFARVTAGERLVVTRHNRTVAVIVGVADAKDFIRSLRGVSHSRKGELLTAFERWIWSDDGKPFEVIVADVAGARPVRELYVHE
jgi:prevent-host-death family protein